MSAAALLQAATSPAEVADVLKGMSQRDRVHRVKLWARLPAGKLDEVAGLTLHSRQQLTNVCFVFFLPHCMLCKAGLTHDA